MRFVRALPFVLCSTLMLAACGGGGVVAPSAGGGSGPPATANAPNSTIALGAAQTVTLPGAGGVRATLQVSSSATPATLAVAASSAALAGAPLLTRGRSLATTGSLLVFYYLQLTASADVTIDTASFAFDVPPTVASAGLQFMEAISDPTVTDATQFETNGPGVLSGSHVTFVPQPLALRAGLTYVFAFYATATTPTASGIFVSDDQRFLSLSQFPIDANGNVAPSTFALPLGAGGTPAALAHDARRNLYVTNNGGPTPSSSELINLVVFAGDESGPISRVSLRGPSGGYAFPGSLIAVTGDGTTIATGAETGGPAPIGGIALFSTPPASGFVTPRAFVPVTPGRVLKGIAFDAGGALIDVTYDRSSGNSLIETRTAADPTVIARTITLLPSLPDRGAEVLAIAFSAAHATIDVLVAKRHADGTSSYEIRRYSATASDPVSPPQTIDVSGAMQRSEAPAEITTFQRLAEDSTGRPYLLIAQDVTGNSSVERFDPDAAGNAVPNRLIIGPAAGFLFPEGITVLP